MERMGGDIFSERLKGGFADTEGVDASSVPFSPLGKVKQISPPMPKRAAAEQQIIRYFNHFISFFLFMIWIPDFCNSYFL